MKTYDELVTMTNQQLTDYLNTEVEKVIENAPPNQVLKLRHLQSRLDKIRRDHAHLPTVVVASLMYDEMIRKLQDLAHVMGRLS